MKLLIDIGNTRLKWAWADSTKSTRHTEPENSGELHGHGSVLTKNISTKPPNALTMSSLTKYSPNKNVQTNVDFEVWISSVASNSVEASIANSWFPSIAQDRINIVSVNPYANGIKNAYADLSKLGVDRWVAILGARHLKPTGHVIVVDAGTAVTVDWLDSNNVFQGGAILPGAGLMHDALVGNTARIESEFRITEQIVGKDTVECVNSGVSFGLVGAVENVVNEMKKVIGQPVQVLLTGGAAAHLSQQLKFSTQVCADLVLLGLLAMSD